MRLIYLFLLISICGNFAHAGEDVISASIECSEFSDLCADSGAEEGECRSTDCHCHHGHMHYGPLYEFNRSNLEIDSFAGTSYPGHNDRNLKNYLNQVHRPPIS